MIYRYFDDFTFLQKEQLQALLGLYKTWNEKINVISRKDIDGVYEKHVLHSLSIAALFNFPEGTHIVDIGTGGGFPGIPLAIFFPSCRFHLVDSTGKKIKVVQEIANALDLKNIIATQSRAEDLEPRQYDFAVSRAVAPLRELWDWSKRLLAKTNRWEEFRNGLICLKGGDLRVEVKESGLHPQFWPIADLFGEDYFKEKYVLYCPA